MRDDRAMGAILKVRLTTAEKELLEDVAEECDMSVSEFARSAIFGRARMIREAFDALETRAAP